MIDIRVLEDPAAELADMLAEAARDGRRIVLTGGSSPGAAYMLAAGREPDWSAASVWFGDERCVPPDHPDSNYAMANRALLSRLTGPPQVMRMEGELGPDAGAGTYEALVREHMGAEPRWDLLLLGLGPDAHYASLFPGKPELHEHRRLVVGVPVAGLPPQVPRISMTLPCLNSARHIVFIVTGASKADAVVRAFGPEPDPEAPASHVRPAAGTLTVLLDEAAAHKLQEQ